MLTTYEYENTLIFAMNEKQQNKIMNTHSESSMSCKFRLRRDLQTKIKITKTAMNLVDIVNSYQELSSTD